MTTRIVGSSNMCGISATVVTPDKCNFAVAEIAKLQGANKAFSFTA